MEHNLLPYICIPTRMKEHSATVIDHINVRILTNQMLTNISSGNFMNDISDHLPNFLIMDCDINKTIERPLIRLYNEKKKNLKIILAMSLQYSPIQEAMTQIYS